MLTNICTYFSRKRYLCKACFFIGQYIPKCHIGKHRETAKSFHCANTEILRFAQDDKGETLRMTPPCHSEDVGRGISYVFSIKYFIVCICRYVKMYVRDRRGIRGCDSCLLQQNIKFYYVFKIFSWGRVNTIVYFDK